MRDLLTELILYPSNGVDTPGYLARPQGDGPFPGVVVIQEWWGLVPHIEDVARRFAHEGFAALAPDLYHGQAAEEPDEARKLAMGLNQERAVQEIQRAVDYLILQPYMQPKKAGVVGWCMGGGLAIAMAARGTQVGASVVFYGSPRDEAVTRQVRVPLLGLFGEDDGGIPVPLVKQFEQQLVENQVPHEIHIYPGAPHAFFNDSRPHIYQREAAQDAWARTLKWFRRYLI